MVAAEKSEGKKPLPLEKWLKTNITQRFCVRYIRKNRCIYYQRFTVLYI